MGIRDELQTEVAAAFDTDLQDAVKNFTGSYTIRGAWDRSRKRAAKRWWPIQGAVFWRGTNSAVSMALTSCMVT